MLSIFFKPPCVNVVAIEINSTTASKLTIIDGPLP